MCVTDMPNKSAGWLAKEAVWLYVAERRYTQSGRAAHRARAAWGLVARSRTTTDMTAFTTPARGRTNGKTDGDGSSTAVAITRRGRL